MFSGKGDDVSLENFAHPDVMKVSKMMKHKTFPAVYENTSNSSLPILGGVFKHISASMTQSDVHSTADQEVSGLIPIGSGNILSWRLIMKSFLVILSLLLIQEGQLSVSGERMCTSTG